MTVSSCILIHFDLERELVARVNHLPARTLAEALWSSCKDRHLSPRPAGLASRSVPGEAGTSERPVGVVCLVDPLLFLTLLCTSEKINSATWSEEENRR